MLGRSFMPFMPFVVLLGLVPANVLCAEPATPVQNKPDPQELVIGDWYEVTVEKKGVKEKLEGGPGPSDG